MISIPITHLIVIPKHKVRNRNGWKGQMHHIIHVISKTKQKMSDTECHRAKYKLQNTKIIQVYLSRSKNTELSSKIL